MKIKLETQLDTMTASTEKSALVGVSPRKVAKTSVDEEADEDHDASAMKKPAAAEKPAKKGADDDTGLKKTRLAAKKKRPG